MRRAPSAPRGTGQRLRRRLGARPAIELSGALWMRVGGDDLGGHDRVELLRAVEAQGSITQAAKAVGLSYKTAWDAIDAMNALAGAPLVERQTGGRGGGSTQLTPHGRRLIDRFAQVEALHARFVRLLSEEGIDLGRDFKLLRMLNMRTSARNQWLGTVSGYRAGAVNDEVELTLEGGACIVATVTRESTRTLGLRPGVAAFALVKASSVMLATGLEGARLSARNQLAGTVTAVVPGAVQAEITLETDEGALAVTATVTRVGADALDLRVGQRAAAVFEASSVILGTLV